jgi:hypothetical protein
MAELPKDKPLARSVFLLIKEIFHHIKNRYSAEERR